MIAFQIGTNESEYIRVSLLNDNGDGWFSSFVEVKVGAFCGSYSADFNSWAFSDFYDQLRKMYDSLSGNAVFTSYEQQLELTLTCNTQGHIKVCGIAFDVAGIGNKLTMNMSIDQTCVPPVLQSLKTFISKYPTKIV
jgi:hypothetical protein